MLSFTVTVLSNDFNQQKSKEGCSESCNNLYLFRLHCCIIFIDVQIVIIVVVVIIVIVVVVVIVVAVADHIDDSLHGDEDKGSKAKGGELRPRGAKWFALL